MKQMFSKQNLNGKYGYWDGYYAGRKNGSWKTESGETLFINKFLSLVNSKIKQDFLEAVW